MTEHNPVNHPSHYNSHPSGVECIDIVEHMPFNVGNAIKYLWRAGLKGDAVEDMRKAIWYIEREIARRTGDHSVRDRDEPKTEQSEPPDTIPTKQWEWETSQAVTYRRSTLPSLEVLHLLNRVAGVLSDAEDPHWRGVDRAWDVVRALALGRTVEGILASERKYTRKPA